MAKKKRNYEEVTNGLQKKKNTPTSEVESGLGERSSNQSNHSEYRG